MLEHALPSRSHALMGNVENAALGATALPLYQLQALMPLQETIIFCWITLVLATKLPGQPHAQAGISCVKPRTIGTYPRWLPQISITLRGELWGPNSLTFGQGAAPHVTFEADSTRPTDAVAKYFAMKVYMTW